MDLSTYFRSVMELSHGIVVTLDTEGRIIHGNALLEQTTGYRLAEIIGENWFTRVVPATERQHALAQFRQCAGREAICDITGCIQRRDGRQVPVQWRLKPLSGSGAAAVMMVGRQIDAGGQCARACSARAEPNRELACLDGVSRLAARTERNLEDTLQDIIALVPPALQQPGGASAALVVDGRRIQTPGYTDATVRLAQEITVGAIRRGYLTMAAAATGGAPPPPPTPEETALVAVVARHVGLLIARKEALDTERDLQMQLRHCDRLAKIGLLAAGVAHELNEPLANILGFAQLAAKAENLSPQVIQDLEHIVSASLHAREVIKKLMSFSRQAPPQKVRINLNRVIEDALVLSASSAARQGVTVACALAPDLPEITADPQQLKQVVINLATNAIQAMPEGGALGIRTHADAEAVVMSIQDSGCGMDDATIEKLFTPFFTTKDSDHGSGLGLSVAHGIVRAHGGSIDVHSRVGSGATFTISFPLTG